MLSVVHACLPACSSPTMHHCVLYLCYDMLVTAHLMGLHSAIKMLVGKLGVIKQQLDLVQQGEPAPTAEMRSRAACSSPEL